jgi:hypothetical protein
MPYRKEFELPELLLELVQVRDKLRHRYNQNGVELKFTPDGRMVGDLGEAIAVELFGLKLTQGTGIDGVAPDGRTSVQVKASGTFGGAAFRPIDDKECAQHLLFFHLDYEKRCGEVIYNGPEAPVRARYVKGKTSQITVTANALRGMDENVALNQRLKRVDSQ